MHVSCCGGPHLSPLRRLDAPPTRVGGLTPVAVIHGALAQLENCDIVDCRWASLDSSSMVYVGSMPQAQVQHVMYISYDHLQMARILIPSTNRVPLAAHTSQLPCSLLPAGVGPLCWCPLP
jgi:hypothetical protein